MNAIRVLKQIDSELADAIPELREMIGQDVEITIRPQSAAEDLPPYETMESLLGDSLHRPPPSEAEMAQLRVMAEHDPALAAALEIAADGGLDVDWILSIRNAGR